jgi:hypothetical protein
MSVALDIRGKLSRFDCSTCERFPDTKAALGCGERPLLSSGQRWSEEWFHARCERRDVDPGPKRASRAWWPANYWHIHDQLGALWPFCPAYYARQYNGPEVDAAHWVLRLANAAEDNRAWMVREQKPLTSREFALVSLATRINRACDREDWQEELKRIREGRK